MKVLYEEMRKRREQRKKKFDWMIFGLSMALISALILFLECVAAVIYIFTRY